MSSLSEAQTPQITPDLSSLKTSPRVRRYDQAIDEAHNLILKIPGTFLIGQGLKSPWYVGKSAVDLPAKYPDQVVDSQVSEAVVTGVGIGLAVTGHPTMILHPRQDFALLAFNEIINQAANWCYMTGGRVGVPLIVRAIVNRGGEQAAQHSQNLSTMFMHVPGLKVVCPANARDAKGLMLAAFEDGNPVIYVDDRWLYDEEGEVPEGWYTTPIGKGMVVRPGFDVTVVSASYLVKLCLEQPHGEVIDLRSLKPWDKDLVLESVRRTGKLVVVDGVWRTAGWGAEIIATVVEELPGTIVRRVSLPDTPAPAASSLEAEYYQTADLIQKVIEELL